MEARASADIERGREEIEYTESALAWKGMECAGRFRKC